MRLLSLSIRRNYFSFHQPDLNIFQASHLSRLDEVWRNQLRKMILKLLTFLSQHPSTSASAPTIDAIFGDDDASKIASDVTGAKLDDGVALAATNDVIFYSMLTILKLQPFANPVKTFRWIFYLKANTILIIPILSH